MMSCSCGKNARQRLYCHNPECGRMLAVDLPRPEVSVTTRQTDSGNDVEVSISRDGKARNYTGGGAGVAHNDAVKQAVEKIIADPHTAEWLPHG